MDTMRQPTNLETLWDARLAKVRRSQERVDVSGMTRPPRDPDERAFLAKIDRLGPFVENQSRPSPSSVSPSTSQRSETV
jgi:hypothetical protein